MGLINLSHEVLIGRLFYDSLGESVRDNAILSLICDEKSGEFLIYVVQVELTGLLFIRMVFNIHESFFTLHITDRKTLIFSLED